MKNKCCESFCGCLMHHMSLAPSAYMVYVGVKTGCSFMLFGGLISGAIVYELCQIKRAIKNSCWY